MKKKNTKPYKPRIAKLVIIFIVLCIIIILFNIFFGVQQLTPSVVMRHDGGVRSATWSRDETKILSGSGDGTARIWNSDGTLILNVKNPYTILGDSTIRQVKWNHDETLILTASFDGTARIWNMEGTELLQIQHNMAYDDKLWGASWNHDESLS